MTLSGGCQCPGTRRIYPPKINPNAATDAIAMFDKNGDGKLSGDELDKCPGLKAGLNRLDPAKTGAVTADMIAVRIAAWRASLLGRMPVRCYVSHNGQPLQGAEVKFVPEKFLGTEIKTASGVTDARGMVMISAPQSRPNDPAGVPPGFYRVEITQSGLAIPAKYNTDTVLARKLPKTRARTSDSGLKFDLDVLNRLTGDCRSFTVQWFSKVFLTFREERYVEYVLCFEGLDDSSSLAWSL